MDLESGCIFWPRIDGDRADFPSLRQAPRCRVAVIGGGITGALVAYHLVVAGVDTVLVDRREPCHGSTAASTGLLQYELDVELHELIGRLGKARAPRAYTRCYDAVGEFRELVHELDDPCDWTARESLYLASKPGDVEGLQRECDARQACGIQVEFLTRAQIGARFSFSRPGALWSAIAGEVDPYRVSCKLLRRAGTHGLKVFGHTEITGYEATSGGIQLRTGAGFSIQADCCVFATGYETPELLRRYVGKLSSTYALATNPLQSFEGWFRRCLIWETDRPYFYARTTRDGRAMIGGGDEEIVEPARRDALIAKKTQMLTGKFREMFPAISMEPACAWAGTFAETKDGLPYIGTCREFPRAYFALGYGGNGITFGLIAAKIIRDAIVGADNADAALFSFER